jgi:thiamine pyrophosphate-dependent acetolactate synthase large subunit-like protein
MTTVAESIVDALARQGVRTIWGVVGDALNPVTDAIRRSDELEWIGVRHEEAGAFAACAQAQLTGTLGVCMGTVGPGSIHLLNGLYDAKKSHAPVLALCGQVPLAVGSYNLGSMANAMPHALGAQALDRKRQVVAFCGDGGLTMLLGDLITAVSHGLPVRLVVFDNGRLGMVKLEQEQGGLPEFGTVLDNPDLAAVARAIGMHGVRVEDPELVDGVIRDAFAHDGPVLIDAITNPDEISLPPKLKPSEAWGFAIAKMTEALDRRGA